MELNINKIEPKAIGCVVYGIGIMAFFMVTVQCVDVQTLTPAQVQIPLNWLRNHGRAELQRENTEKGTGKDQYLAAMVISSDAVIASETAWRAIAAKLTSGNGNETRLKVLINDDNNQYHGEYNLVENDIDGMMRKCNNDVACIDPVIVLYSFYIPCSNMRSLTYQCSEVLMTWKLNYEESHGIKTKMMVGYDRIFSGHGYSTDEIRSKWYMEMAEIVYFQYDEDSSVYTKPSVFVPNQNENVVQNWMYNCLTGVYLSSVPRRRGQGRGDPPFCVIGKTPVMLRYFLNYMMHQCTYHLPLLGFPVKEHFKRCLTAKTREQVTTDCPLKYYPRQEISVRRNLKHLEACFNVGLSKANRFGLPLPRSSPDGENYGKLQLASQWRAMNDIDVINDLKHWYSSQSSTVWDDVVIPGNLVRCRDKNGDLKVLCSPKVRAGKRPAGSLGVFSAKLPKTS